MKTGYLFVGLALIATPALADMAEDLSGLVGYTVIASKTIEGWYDSDGKKGDSFEGCNIGRTIVFTDNQILQCSEYGYQYAYQPTAAILSNGHQIKMVVEDTVYEMQR